MRPNNELLRQVIDAAIAAGREIMAVYDDPAFDTQVAYKSDHSPVTIADRRAHDCIAAALAVPSTGSTDVFPLMSEEGSQAPYDERAATSTYWLVDPLDGTKEFLKRNGEFTVNIALIDNGKPILGVVYVPATRVIYFAGKGMGAFKGEIDAEENFRDRPTRMPIAEAKRKRPYTVMTSRSHLSAETATYIEAVKAAHPDAVTIQSGSSLKICLVAEGLADEYPRLGPTMEWDTAAAHAVLREANGDLVDHENGETLKYNKADLHNPWFIARINDFPAKLMGF